MRVAIISRGNQVYSTRRLMEAAELSGHQTQILDPFGFSLHVQNDNIRIFYNGYVAENFDLIIPRFSAATAEFGFEILSHFASLHTACIINSPDAIQNARHKFRSLRILAEHNIPILPSFTTGTTESLEQSVSYIGAEYPVIAKPFIGTHGKGIMLLDTLISLQSAIGAMCDVNRNYVVQKYVDLNSSGDVRVIVVGDKAVAGMKRVPQNGEFRLGMTLYNLSPTFHPLRSSVTSSADCSGNLSPVGHTLPSASRPVLPAVQSLGHVRRTLPPVPGDSMRV